MPSGAESAGQLQRRSMQFFVLLNIPGVILAQATTTSLSLTRTSVTTSTLESSPPFKTMWADLQLTPETSPEKQALKVLPDQRLQAQGLDDPQDLGGLVGNLEFGTAGPKEALVQAIVGEHPPVGTVEYFRKQAALRMVACGLCRVSQ